MQKMSKKASLAKKIAHTLMAMSIVYSSGINIVINEAYAAEKTENITNGGTKEFEQIGIDGQDYNKDSLSDPITSGADAILTGKITEADVSSGEIRVLANGGRGGNDYIYGPQLQKGTNGGTAVAKVTVDESLSSITTDDITVSAYSGAHGSAYQGVSGVHGAAAAYGFEVKHDLTITAADIFVSAKSGEGGINTSAVDIAAAKGNDVVAVGLQADNSTVSFSGGSLKVEAINKGINTRDVETAGKEKLSAGGDTEAYGIRVNGGEVTATLTGELLIMSALAADGGGSTYDSGSGGVHSNYGSAAGGDGGYAAACGIKVNGGIAHLNLQDIITTDSSTFASSYFSGGAGADGAMADNGVSGSGGKGGDIAVTGVHVASGEANGSIGAINLDVNKSNANGGNGGSGKNGVGNCGSGGDAGAVYAAGVRVDGGEAELTVTSIDIKAAAGSGGKIGLIEITDASKITATGTVQAAGGKGGAVQAVGVDNRGGSSNVTATGDIKIVATGGTGGTAVIGEIANVTGDASAILAAERASGAGGEATAVGLQNTVGSLTAAVQKLEITATGGKGGAGMSSYGAVNGVGAKGGAAAAYGINVLGGLAENLTAVEITVQATGGTSEYPNESANYKGCVNANGTGVTGTTGGDGATGAAYGISNSGGSAGVTVTKITAEAVGGAGSKGGGVTYQSGTPAGIGGDGGNGGNAYAYGVYGSGAASVTAVAADEIIASATAGAAGAGAAIEYGVATAGQSGSKGEEAKAYGVYAAGGAVIELSAKTGGNVLKINAKAADGAVTNEAYAVYADKSTVLFGSNAALNWDGSTGTDNTLVTSLNNATLGFSGKAANRTVTGGKLQLTDSNAFRFTTDLANNKADSMTFDTIENNSSKQYIQIGYEEAFKNALSEADIVTVNGSATVLKITNLNGQNLNNFVGQASSLDSPLERFRVTPKVEASGNEVKITEVALAKEDTPSETAMTLSDAQMALGSMWRIEGNNLMKRMGDLRSDKEAAQGGVWARYYRGELNTDSAYDRNFSQDYTAFQGGIDKVQDYKGGKLYTGIAINRIDSNAGYTAGSGDLSSTGVGLYASWLGSKGHYLDVIARGSKLTNDFKLVDLSGNAAKADYDTWAYGISAEYGYRQNLNAGWFVEPQAELSLGHLGSADYTTSNGVSVKQDSVNSAVVRLGFLGGKEFTISGRTSNAYVKASALHDFGGNGGATGYYENSSLALKTGDLTGTWYEIGVGANLGIAKNSNLYFDALKTFGGNLRTDWQFNAGLRFTF